MANAASSLDMSSISSTPRDIPNMTSPALPLLYPTSQALAMPSQFSTNSLVCPFSNLESIIVAASIYRSAASFLTSSASNSAVMIDTTSSYSPCVFGMYDCRPDRVIPNLSTDVSSKESITSLYSFAMAEAAFILPLKTDDISTSKSSRIC